MRTRGQPVSDHRDDVDLAALVQTSRSLGSRADLVLGGGGNTSVKLGDRLLVKASGTALSQVSAEGFVELDRPALQSLLERGLSPSRHHREAEFKAAVLAARREPGRGQRPSVEALLHHLTPGRFVVHLHANLVNQFGCCREGKRLVLAALGDDVCWIDLVDPGFSLAQALQAELTAFAGRAGRAAPRAVILQNHGLVVSGDTPHEATLQLDWLLASLASLKEAAVRDATARGHPAPAELAPGQQTGPRATAEMARTIGAALEELLAGEDGSRAAVTFDGSEEVRTFASAQNGRALALAGPLTPDQIVYCRSFPLWLVPRRQDTPSQLQTRVADAVKSYRRHYRAAPAVVIAEGLGLFAGGRDRARAEVARAVYADAMALMLGAAQLGGVLPLPEDFTQFIENWEVEAYRRQVI